MPPPTCFLVPAIEPGAHHPAHPNSQTTRAPVEDGKWAVPRRAVLESAAVPPPTDFVVLDPTPESQPIALPSTTLPRMRGGGAVLPPA